MKMLLILNRITATVFFFEVCVLEDIIFIHVLYGCTFRILEGIDGDYIQFKQEFTVDYHMWPDKKITFNFYAENEVQLFWQVKTVSSYRNNPVNSTYGEPV